MIKNIKIHNIVDIIENFKSMELKIYTLFFQNSMGIRKSRCDVPNDTTQEYFHSLLTTFQTSFTQSNFPMSTTMKSKQGAAQRFYTMCGVLNNNHPTCRITIVCIVNHNLYQICGHYIYYGILNVTMDMSSCNGCFKKNC